MQSEKKTLEDKGFRLYKRRRIMWREIEEFL